MIRRLVGRMVVTGDTNFYRKIVENVSINELWKLDAIVKEITRAEKRMGIKAMMGSIAASELLSHLLDSTQSRDYRSCIKACRVMYGHCVEDENSYSLLPSPQTQIAMEYFGKQNDLAINTQKVLGGVVSQIAKHPNVETIAKFSSELNQVKTHIQGTEQCLIDEVLGMCKAIDPNYTDWHLFVGDKKKRQAYLSFCKSQNFKDQTALAMLVAVNIQLAGQGLVSQNLVTSQMVSTFVSSYKVALSLREFFFCQILNPGFDLSTNSRANFLWDEQILYFVDKKVGNEDVVLLTSDNKMCDAAQACGVRDKVKKYDEYIEEIGIVSALMAIKKGRCSYFLFRMKRMLSAIWQFCSYLFVPQWGKRRRMEGLEGID